MIKKPYLSPEQPEKKKSWKKGQKNPKLFLKVLQSQKLCKIMEESQ